MGSTRNPRSRWLVPAVAATLVVGVPLAVSTAASAEPALPARSAQELLVDLQQVKAQPLSGEIRQSMDLGLPQLPGFATPTMSGASLGSVLALASGTHTWRFWTDGAQGERLALVETTSESDLIRNGSDAWLWSSADKSAVHTTLTPGKDAHPTPSAVPRTPQEAADEILKALDPTTEVSTTSNAEVAGRPAYQLVLTPKQSGTKVERVTLALDAATKVPLRVQVFAHDGTDAIDVGFTSVTFAAPDESLFTFTPPPGTTVKEQQAPEASPNGTANPTPPKPTVIGTGWTTVVVDASTLSPDKMAGTSSDRSVAQVLDALPRVSGAWGSGRLLDGTLVSVVLADDGRIAAGAVPPDQLYAALTR